MMPDKKKPRRERRAGVVRSAVRKRKRSEAAEQRAAELVVDAGREQVDVLLDAVRAETAVEGDVLAIQEDMVVFEAERPVRSEAVFDAGADRGTPTGVVVRAEVRAGDVRVQIELVVDNRGTALGVQQHVVEGVADLAGEPAEGIHLAV